MIWPVVRGEDVGQQVINEHFFPTLAMALTTSRTATRTDAASSSSPGRGSIQFDHAQRAPLDQLQQFISNVRTGGDERYRRFARGADSGDLRFCIHLSDAVRRYAGLRFLQCAKIAFLCS